MGQETMEERKGKIGERNSNASWLCSRDRQTYNIGLPSVVWRHKGSMWLLILAVSHMDPPTCASSDTLVCPNTHTHSNHSPQSTSATSMATTTIYSPSPVQASCDKALRAGRDFQRWRAVCGRGQLFETGSEMPTWPPYLRPSNPWETITEARAFDVSTAVKAKTGIEINRGSRRRGQSFFLLLGGGVSPFEGWVSLKKEKYLEERLQTEQKEIKNQVRSDPMREAGISSLLHQTRCNCKIGLNT